jgi:hypothetical protein
LGNALAVASLRSATHHRSCAPPPDAFASKQQRLRARLDASNFNVMQKSHFALLQASLSMCTGHQP